MNTLLLGNLNYSSWSVRAALIARASGLGIAERIVPLGVEETKTALIKETGLHTVPVLLSGDLIIRDSLAIAEWIAERAPVGKVWPSDPDARALARSACAEMHSGFFALRSQMPVDIRSRTETPDLTPALTRDIDRVLEIWETLLGRPGSGPFLFGEWSAADAFYAPVVTRFSTYGYDLEGKAKQYAEAVWAHPSLTELRAQAEVEPWEIEMGTFGPVRAWRRQ